jgi:hypothetical protein
MRIYRIIFIILFCLAFYLLGICVGIARGEEIHKTDEAGDWVNLGGGMWGRGLPPTVIENQHKLKELEERLERLENYITNRECVTLNSE